MQDRECVEDALIMHCRIASARCGISCHEVFIPPATDAISENRQATYIRPNTNKRSISEHVPLCIILQPGAFLFGLQRLALTSRA